MKTKEDNLAITFYIVRTLRTLSPRSIASSVIAYPSIRGLSIFSEQLMVSQ